MPSQKETFALAFDVLSGTIEDPKWHADQVGTFLTYARTLYCFIAAVILGIMGISGTHGFIAFAAGGYMVYCALVRHLKLVADPTLAIRHGLPAMLLFTVLWIWSHTFFQHLL